MKIIVDAMGGDNAPQEIVKGAVRARRELGVEIELVGRREEVEACLAAEGCADIPVVRLPSSPPPCSRRPAAACP